MDEIEALLMKQSFEINSYSPVNFRQLIARTMELDKAISAGDYDLGKNVLVLTFDVEPFSARLLNGGTTNDVVLLDCRLNDDE